MPERVSVADAGPDVLPALTRALVEFQVSGPDASRVWAQVGFEDEAQASFPVSALVRAEFLDAGLVSSQAWVPALDGFRAEPLVWLAALVAPAASSPQAWLPAERQVATQGALLPDERRAALLDAFLQDDSSTLLPA